MFHLEKPRAVTLRGSKRKQQLLGRFYPHWISSIWERYVPKRPSKPPKGTPFLTLPLEIRLEIYSYLTVPWCSISRPTSHSLYPLLFVSHTIRDDIAYIFYHTQTPSFTFFSPQSCTFFLDTTTFSIHRITSLTLYVPSDKTHLVEPIFRKLYLANASLKKLEIHLVDSPGRFTEKERVVTAYMLPRRIGLSPEGIAHLSLEWLSRRAEPGLLDRKDDFVYADTHSVIAVRLAESCTTALGRLKCVRYLAVYGQPKHGLDFELSILKIHMQMDQVAKAEGKRLVQGYGSRLKDEKSWYYDVWIEGEMERDDPMSNRLNEV